VDVILIYSNGRSFSTGNDLGNFSNILEKEV
jgi:enoyl-CoA hydratase/carnithine racemase